MPEVLPNFLQVFDILLDGYFLAIGDGTGTAAIPHVIEDYRAITRELCEVLI